MDPTATDDAELRAEEIAEEYLDRLHAGAAPDRAALLAAHSDIASVLADHLSVVERMFYAARDSVGRPTAPDDQPPERVGRYFILETLGRGASGTVYRAYDPKFDRDVALKVLRAETLSDPEAAARFHREARIAAQLRHPYIVPLHETGEENGHLYLDMAFVPGETLEQRLTHHPLSFAEAAHLIEKLAEALDYAHSKDIIHRDVKPSNVLLQENPNADCADDAEKSDGSGFLSAKSAKSAFDIDPQLTDFGLARRIGAEASLTEHGQVIGTLSYMPPEQAKGGAHKADARSDVYGLGAVFYRLLTGNVPFPGEGSLHSQVYHIVNDEPPKPRTVNATIPKDLETICLKAMAKDPPDRFATAAAIADELRRWQKDESLTIRPPTWWEKGRRWARRNRAVAWAVAVTVALFLVSGILGAMYWHSRSLQTLEANVRAAVQYQNILIRARQVLLTPTEGRAARTQSILEEVSTPRNNLESGEERDKLDVVARSLYAMSLSVPDFAEKEESPNLPTVFWQPWQVAIHPTGRHMAIGTPSRPVRWDRGTPCEFLDGVDPEIERPRIAFNRDGKYLAMAPAAGGLKLYGGDLRGDPLAERLPIENRRVIALAFHSNEPLLSIACDDSRIHLLSLPDLQRIHSWEAGPVPISAAAFAVNAARVATGDNAGNVRIWSHDGKRIQEFTTREAGIHVQALAWSPDARHVAVGRRDGSVELLEISTSVTRWRATICSHGVSNLLFHPTGQWLVGGWRGDPMKMWDAVNGRQLLSLDRYVPMDFSQDGRVMAMSHQEQVAFADLTVPTTVKPLIAHRTTVEHLVWSRDERYVVSFDAAFELHVWDVERAESIMSVRAPRSDDQFFPMNARVGISDDGTVVAYVSAGTEISHACMYEVPSGKSLCQCKLDGGFETLAFDGKAFVLVREEREPPKTGPRQSVVYDWAVGGQPCRRPGPPLRPSQPGDESGYFASELTSNGRHFLWNGPRKPYHQRRLEVYDLAAPDKPIRTFDRSHAIGPNTGLSGHLSPDGRYLHVELGGTSYSVFDLRIGMKMSSAPPPKFSENMHRKVYFRGPDDTWFCGRIRVPMLDHEDKLVELFNLDFSNTSSPTVTHLSPRGRYLAWRDWSGGITVADLPALDGAIEEFARVYLPK